MDSKKLQTREVSKALEGLYQFLDKHTKSAKKSLWFFKYPLRDGYSQVVYTFNGQTKRPPDSSPIEPLNQTQKNFLLFFLDGLWDTERLAAFLRQHCNATNPESMTWPRICHALVILAEREGIAPEDIKKYPKLTYSIKPEMKWDDPNGISSQQAQDKLRTEYGIERSLSWFTKLAKEGKVRHAEKGQRKKIHWPDLEKYINKEGLSNKQLLKEATRKAAKNILKSTFR